MADHDGRYTVASGSEAPEAPVPWNSTGGPTQSWRSPRDDGWHSQSWRSTRDGGGWRSDAWGGAGGGRAWGNNTGTKRPRDSGDDGDGWGNNTGSTTWDSGELALPKRIQGCSDPSMFAGGRWVLKAPPQCDDCKNFYPDPSCLVSCNSETGFTSATRANPQTRQSIGLTSSSNFLAQRAGVGRVVSICFWCYGKKFYGNSWYFLQTTPIGVKLRSDWGNMRKSMFRDSTENRELRNAIQHLRATAPQQEMSLDSVYQKVALTKHVGAAGDFHMDLGGGFHLAYTCVACSSFPTHPRNWLRATTRAYQHQAGGTSQHGHWHCPAAGCLQRWRWAGGGGALRVLILPQGPNDDDKNVPMMFIGKTTEAQNHQISLLKSARLLQATPIDLDQPVDPKKLYDGLIQGLQTLNDNSETAIISRVQLSYQKSAQLQEIDDKGLFPYCENGQLSLNEPGRPYTSASVRGIATLNETDSQNILDELCGLFDFSGAKPSMKNKKGNLMQAWEKCRTASDAARSRWQQSAL